MIGTLYSTPQFFARALSSLPRTVQSNQSRSVPSRIGNIAPLPRQPKRLQNYAAATQPWMPRAPSSFAGAQQASTTGPHRLCSFTGLLLRSNGCFNRSDAAAYLTTLPRTVLSIGTPVTFSVAANAKATATPPGTASSAQPPVVDSSISDAADQVVENIADIRRRWQAGMFAEPARVANALTAAVERVQAEIASARTTPR